MAMREFVDSRGSEWRAWDITPERMHPVTAREMFQGQYVDFMEGWIVFESAGERRRLAPYPSAWADFSVAQLEALLALATSAPIRTSTETPSGTFKRYEEDRAGTTAQAAEPALAASLPAGDVGGRPHAAAGRTFTGPSGRAWVVGLVERGGEDVPLEGRRTLQFTSNDGAVRHLREFPEDWARLPRERLLDLLRRAVPSRDTTPHGATPRRRT
jgi:hypothetical protein